jgi:hypothetical protein
MGMGKGGDMMIEDFKISSDALSFQVEGILYSFALLEISPRLAKASDAERGDYKFSPSGYGIHWESIDEDISLPALINMK